MHTSVSFLFSRIKLRVLWIPLLLCITVAGSLAVPNISPVWAKSEALGFPGASFSTTTAPAAAENQSKLWFNDGTWWGSLYNNYTGQFEIFRYNSLGHFWITTGTLIDPRKTTRADCLWDGVHLYIVSAVRPDSVITNKQIRILRYTYDPVLKSYSLDAGFPVSLTNSGTIGAVIDKDSTGTLWVTFTTDNGSGGNSVFIAHSTGDDAQWTTPYVLPVPGTADLFTEDISALVAFKDHIGLMWSNQTEHAMYFAEHTDGDSDQVWRFSAALQGNLLADNHINLKTYQDGDNSRVFAAVKTSLNDADSANPNAPLLVLLERKPDGTWTNSTFGTVSERHTRPVMLFDLETQSMYLFATSFCCGTGEVYYKKASLNSPAIQFPEGLGTPFLQLGQGLDINDVTSTKQTLRLETSGMMVLAEDRSTSQYVHQAIESQSGPPVLSEPPPDSGSGTIILLPFLLR